MLSTAGRTSTARRLSSMRTSKLGCRCSMPHSVRVLLEYDNMIESADVWYGTSGNLKPCLYENSTVFCINCLNCMLPLNASWTCHYQPSSWSSVAFNASQESPNPVRPALCTIRCCGAVTTKPEVMALWVQYILYVFNESLRGLPCSLTALQLAPRQTQWCLCDSPPAMTPLFGSAPSVAQRIQFHLGCACGWGMSSSLEFAPACSGYTYVIMLFWHWICKCLKFNRI